MAMYWLTSSVKKIVLGELKPHVIVVAPQHNGAVEHDVAIEPIEVVFLRFLQWLVVENKRITPAGAMEEKIREILLVVGTKDDARGDVGTNLPPALAIDPKKAISSRQIRERLLLVS